MKQFDFEITKAELEALPSNREKIIHLINTITEFKQVMNPLLEMARKKHPFDKGFDELCETEIEKLKKISELEKPDNHDLSERLAGFKISDKKGTKIDLLRVFSALYELRLIEKQNGDLPNKKEFIEAIGKFLGTDFSKFHQDLSQAFQGGSIESNTEIFDKLKNQIIEAKTKSEEKKK